MIKLIVKRTLHLIAGIIFCLVIPIIIKQFLLRPIRFNIIGDNPSGQIFQWGISLILIISGYVLFVRIIEKRKVKELSFQTFAPGTIKGGLWGTISIGGILLILFLSGVFSIKGINGNIHTYQMLLLLFLLSTTEEILYRGILYRLIEKWGGTVAALITSSFLFSIMHLRNDHFNIYSFLAILFGGLIMGLMYTKTKNLWFPIAAHFTWNYSQIIMGIRLSGSDDFSNLSLLKTELSGNSLLTGGNFGVENSLITIGYTALIALILGVLIYREKKSV